ncbi:MAG: hypothetical protein QOJ55_589 [Solirubrobacteraceae bacterium]|jgi:hypothetical protein|nr:hypothetical protein [Solirubrobacteraceae bacterium]
MAGNVLRFRGRKTTPDGAEETDETAVQSPPREVERPGVRRRMAARGAGVVATFGTGVARLIRLAVILVALIIGLAILFKTLGANPHNTIVSGVHDAGRALAGPFDSMFKLHGAKVALAVNWGIALVVYLVVGFAIARFVGRLATARPVARRRRLVEG